MNFGLAQKGAAGIQISDRSGGESSCASKSQLLTSLGSLCLGEFQAMLLCYFFLSP
jgi:hypothetical protein